MHEDTELDDLPEFWRLTILKLRSENYQLRKRYQDLRIAVVALRSLKNRKRFGELNAAIDDLHAVNSRKASGRRELAPRSQAVTGEAPTTSRGPGGDHPIFVAPGAQTSKDQS